MSVFRREFLIHNDDGSDDDDDEFICFVLFGISERSKFGNSSNWTRQTLLQLWRTVLAMRWDKIQIEWEKSNFLKCVWLADRVVSTVAARLFIWGMKLIYLLNNM